MNRRKHRTRRALSGPPGAARSKTCGCSCSWCRRGRTPHDASPTREKAWEANSRSRIKWHSSLEVLFRRYAGFLLLTVKSQVTLVKRLLRLGSNSGCRSLGVVVPTFHDGLLHRSFLQAPVDVVRFVSSQAQRSPTTTNWNLKTTPKSSQDPNPCPLQALPREAFNPSSTLL